MAIFNFRILHDDLQLQGNGLAPVPFFENAQLFGIAEVLTDDDGDIEEVTILEAFEMTPGGVANELYPYSDCFNRFALNAMECAARRLFADGGNDWEFYPEVSRAYVAHTLRNAGGFSGRGPAFTGVVIDNMRMRYEGV